MLTRTLSRDIQKGHFFDKVLETTNKTEVKFRDQETLSGPFWEIQAKASRQMQT